MDEQQRFAERIKELTELALDQDNVIFEDQLFDIFPEIKDDEAKYDVIKEFLSQKKIGLNTKISFEDMISDDEKTYLNYYLEDLASQEPLSDGEKKAFTMSAMAGDESAQMIIMQDFLKNVVEIAKLYVGQGVLIEDLIGEGNVALVSSITEITELEKPGEVEGFLSARVMDAMQDFIAAAMDANSDEEKALKKVNKIAKEARELAETLGRKVTIEELSLETGISRAQIEKALKLTANNIEDIEIPDDLK